MYIKCLGVSFPSVSSIAMISVVILALINKVLAGKLN